MNLKLVNQKVCWIQTLDISSSSKATISLILAMTLTLYKCMSMHINTKKLDDTSILSELSNKIACLMIQ